MTDQVAHDQNDLVSRAQFSNMKLHDLCFIPRLIIATSNLREVTWRPLENLFKQQMVLRWPFSCRNLLEKFCLLGLCTDTVLPETGAPSVCQPQQGTITRYETLYQNTQVHSSDQTRQQTFTTSEGAGTEKQTGPTRGWLTSLRATSTQCIYNTLCVHLLSFKAKSGHLQRHTRFAQPTLPAPSSGARAHTRRSSSQRAASQSVSNKTRPVASHTPNQLSANWLTPNLTQPQSGYPSN